MKIYNGNLFISSPPLYRFTKNGSNKYFQNKNKLEEYILKLAFKDMHCIHKESNSYISSNLLFNILMQFNRIFPQIKSLMNILSENILMLLLTTIHFNYKDLRNKNKMFYWGSSFRKQVKIKYKFDISCEIIQENIQTAKKDAKNGVFFKSNLCVLIG